MLFVLDLMCQFLLQIISLDGSAFKNLFYIHNQQFILVACCFLVLSSSSLLFSLIHLFRVVSRLGFDFCSSFVFSGDSFGRGVEGLEAVR